MCLIGFAFHASPEVPLLIAANRDERHDRPALAATFWDDRADVLGGRDLRGGGTWLGVTRAGRVAALTNYRAPEYMRASDGRSRGLLVMDFLVGDGDAEAFARRLRAERERYAGYNLLFGDEAALWVYHSHVDGLVEVAPGVHGLSNHLLDTPWPKVERIKAAVSAALAPAEGVDIAALHAALRDPRLAPDDELPDTGVGISLERLLSAPFIVGEDYGTRACSVVTIDRSGAIAFEEERFGPGGRYVGGVRHYLAPGATT